VPLGITSGCGAGASLFEAIAPPRALLRVPEEALLEEASFAGLLFAVELFESVVVGEFAASFAGGLEVHASTVKVR
jgi:hypothetical protein